jgi:hypothetical protein
MNKRWAVAAAMATVVSVGAGSTAGAAPSKNVETWICNGMPTEITVAGRNGWIGGQHYQAHNFSIVGTFTPTGGTPETINETKWTTGRSGLNCTMSVDFTDEEGRFVAVLRVTAVPVG